MWFVANDVAEQLRMVMIGDDPWFVGSDVCKMLGIGDVSRAVEKLDDDEKGTSSIRTLGGDQNSIIVSEGGLYTLILRSRDALKLYCRGTLKQGNLLSACLHYEIRNAKGISSIDTLEDRI